MSAPLLKLQKVVAALPATLEADTVYLVRAGAGVDVYVTNHAGLLVAYPLNQPAGGAPLRVADGAVFTVRDNAQVLMSEAIDVDGEIAFDGDGVLVEVT